MVRQGSLILTGLTAVAFLFANPGAGFAQRGGGHGGGGSAHGGGGSAHGGGGSAHSGGGSNHAGGGNYHSGGSYYRGGNEHGGYYRSGIYGGIYGSLYASPFLGYGNAYATYPFDLTPNYYVPSPVYPAGTYVPPAITIAPQPPLREGYVNPMPPLEQPAGAALVEVYVPASADVWFDDLKTKQTGEQRTFKSPTLEPGKSYLYDIKARWMENGQEVVRTKTVRVQAGRTAHVDFITQ